jgi:hypothetical protein
MPLDQDQIDKLMTSVADTRDREMACDECLAGMAEYAEANLLGLEMSEALDSVRAHIDFCGECAEEYEALLEALHAAAEAPEGTGWVTRRLDVDQLP